MVSSTRAQLSVGCVVIYLTAKRLPVSQSGEICEFHFLTGYMNLQTSSRLKRTLLSDGADTYWITPVLRWKLHVGD